MYRGRYQVLLKSRGTSVLEILFALVAAILIFVVIWNFFIKSSRQWQTGYYKFTAQNEAQFMLELIKRDLLTAMKPRLSQPIFIEDGPQRYSFYKFAEDFAEHQFTNLRSRPLPEKITYIFDSNAKTLTRTINRHNTSSSGAEETRVFNYIKRFELIPYMLNNRRYFRINVDMELSKETTRIREETIYLVTSVESRFENNLIHQSSWVNNPQSEPVEW